MRDGGPDDAAALVALFRDAVRIGAASHYDAAQRAAWAPDDLDADDWRPRLAQQHVLVAQAGEAIAGFIVWNDVGYVDLLFTTPAWMRRGVATTLCREAERRLRDAGAVRMTTNASHLSRPLFEREGWTRLQEDSVRRDGVALVRFPMRKDLV